MSTQLTKVEQVELDQAVEEIRAIFVEAEFASRWILIEAYHKVGQIIINLPGFEPSHVQQIAKAIGRGERVLEYAVKFARTYKSVDDLPEGKNVTWTKVIREHLTTPEEKGQHVHNAISICSSCKMRLD